MVITQVSYPQFLVYCSSVYRRSRMTSEKSHIRDWMQKQNSKLTEIVTGTKSVQSHLQPLSFYNSFLCFVPNYSIKRSRVFVCQKIQQKQQQHTVIKFLLRRDLCTEIFSQKHLQESFKRRKRFQFPYLNFLLLENLEKELRHKWVRNTHFLWTQFIIPCNREEPKPWKIVHEYC